MNYIVLDMEWNQAPSRAELIREPVNLFGEIIQIGAVKLDSKFRQLCDIKIEVLPKYYTKINHYVGELTGIATGDLLRGIPFPEAYRKFDEWCGDDYRIITWGPDDITTLRTNMILHGMDEKSIKPSYDLQRIFNSQITGENRQWSLSGAMERLGIELDLPCHDARNDAIYTARILERLDIKKGIEEYIPPQPKLKQPQRERYAALKKHLIDKKEFSQNDKLYCPYCNKQLKVLKRLRLRNRDKIFTAHCEKNGGFLIILKRKGGAENDIKYEKYMYKLCEDSESFLKKFRKKQADIKI